MKSRRAFTLRVRAALSAAALVLTGIAAAAPARAEPAATVVLVHGAFADASGWSAVAARLSADGYSVRTFDNPLRGPAYDASKLTEFLADIDGPIVLVGHSYGGVVVTNTHDPDVKANVYIAAFAPEQGQRMLELLNPIPYPGSLLLPPALLAGPVPDPASPVRVNLDAFVTEPFFREVFCQDVAPAEAANLFRHQKSAAIVTNLEPTGIPSWTTTPSWYLVSGQDRVIPPALQRATAARVAPGRTSEVDASHASYVSRPDAVADIVRVAAGG
ncbi:alpha/beta fold hydrolase [Nocardia takedensis]|uniref:alpha/beta fold hydrolase n=1 Tax=Nocardia takedensis TaxID=259390 RepID=UPI00030F4E29|nr:alpha/beta hydrolase [Nocardia takedensis]